MWLIREVFGWIFLAAFLAGIVGLGMSYRVRHDRRENMLAVTLQQGCIGGLLVSAVIVPIVVLVVWLTN